MRGARREQAIRLLSRRFKAMDSWVQQGHDFVSLLHPRMQGETLRILLISYWRPRRDLNPCYRRESLRLKAPVVARTQLNVYGFGSPVGSWGDSSITFIVNISSTC
jgi:hypothetical protein